MSDDLVKRLRDWEHVWPDDMNKPAGHLYEDAADRIEELERAVRYEADIAQQALDSRKELQAKLFRAEGLLVDAMVQLENGKIKTRRNCAYLIGQFLAELKGEADE